MFCTVRELTGRHEAACERELTFELEAFRTLRVFEPARQANRTEFTAVARPQAASEPSDRRSRRSPTASSRTRSRGPAHRADEGLTPREGHCTHDPSQRRSSRYTRLNETAPAPPHRLEPLHPGSNALTSHAEDPDENS